MAKVTLEQLLQRVKQRHGDIIVLDKSSYTNMKTPCVWFDKDFGEFFKKPNAVVNGGSHPKRYAVNQRARCIEKYGVEHHLQLKSVIDKRKKTCLNKYGCENVNSCDSVKLKKKETFRKRYGSDYYFQTKEFRVGLLKKYGYVNPSQQPGYFESHPNINGPDAQRKHHETMKRNGTYNTSKPEEKLYRLLCEKYGIENVERQRVVNRWPIDFYVSTTDTYVQCDGIYWHGLNRSLEEVAQHKTKRDAQIHKKMLTDIEQASYFEKNGLKLVRIREDEV